MSCAIWAHNANRGGATTVPITNDRLVRRPISEGKRWDACTASGVAVAQEPFPVSPVRTNNARRRGTGKVLEMEKIIWPSARLVSDMHGHGVRSTICVHGN